MSVAAATLAGYAQPEPRSFTRRGESARFSRP